MLQKDAYYNTQDIPKWTPGGTLLSEVVAYPGERGNASGHMPAEPAPPTIYLYRDSLESCPEWLRVAATLERCSPEWQQF